jgi:predicted nucleotidyltransferase component of viral defense system
MPIHATYGVPSLPELQVVRLEENIAEKISRLNRTTTARGSV